MKSVGILLFIVGIGNFVYQGILILRKLRKEANEVRTTHRFCCTACGEKYELSTVETKEKIKWSIHIRKETLNTQKSLYKFICPICGEKKFQERLYDLNITRLKGRIRYQGTEFQLRELVLFFLKGVLPLLLVRYLLRFLI
ncbi:TPA: hypothetical protein ACWWET_001846 [Enterococcus faecalis]|uniref:hypothetical protein n=1 Tax=Enterococcus faecalis TaxID=1351 RepID=UPI0011433D13|nr:hypothetical protein [Enterococcus faecalis]EGO8511419.1 hypothetical protein [Enterococcus faecalis]EGO8995478.1 hypothetical protein [Enterococcus faecalis]EGQ7426675.1 hypothetical protein [Enterococcus faecalis]EHV0153154.1 hypothetical protein [Enterococcus faecalis]NSV45496.1 hypothetical protein [Enterococcus faecalis]